MPTNPFGGPIQPMQQPRAPLTTAQKATGGAIGLILTASLAAVYVNEGGYADHPADRGGKTMFGVTEREARAWGYRGAMIDFPKRCSPEKPVCADRIYTTNYIDKPGYRPMATIEPAVFFEMVDSAVLHGPGRSSMWFQASLNTLCGSSLKIDGQVGPKAIAAYETCQARQGKTNLCLKMLEVMDGTQKRFFDKIVANNPSQRVFYKGWINGRVGNVPRAKCADWAA